MRAWCTLPRRSTLLLQRQLSTCQQLRRRRVPTNEALLGVLDSLKGSEGFIEKGEHAPKQNTSSKAQQLAPSPLTDPKLNVARFGHKTPKPSQRREELSEFQLKLQKNPYAHALATPPRCCLLTKARLPSYFLLQFGLATHPETEQKWHLPTLAAVNAAAGAEDGAHEGEKFGVDGDTLLDSKNQVEVTGPQALPPRTLSGTHFLSSWTALKHVTRLQPARYRGLLPHRWREDGAFKVNEVVWREDMADYTLGLMREKAVNQIKRLADRKSAMYMVPCEEWEDVKKKSQVGAVLWVGGDDDRLDSEEAEESKPVEPPLYAMLHVSGIDLPVYNARSLLGQQHLDNLRSQLPAIFNKELVTVKGKRLTVQLQLWLWKLTGYLAP